MVPGGLQTPRGRGLVPWRSPTRPTGATPPTRASRPSPRATGRSETEVSRAWKNAVAPGPLRPRRPGTTTSTPSATTRRRDIAGRRVGGLPCARAECPQRPDDNDEKFSAIAAFEKFRSAFGRAVSPFEPINDQNPWVKRLGQSKSTQQLLCVLLKVLFGVRGPPATEERASRGSGRRQVPGRPEDINMPPSDMGGAQATDDANSGQGAQGASPSDPVFCSPRDACRVRGRSAV